MSGIFYTYGYRHNEVNLAINDVPDQSYRLKYMSNQLLNRGPMRRSLNVHFIGAALPVPDTAHSLSQAEGAIKRVAANMPVINRARLRRLKRFTTKFLEKEFAGQQFKYDEEFDIREWLDNTDYKAYRKEELYEISKEHFNEQKGYNLKGFCKDENYPEYKAFRGIHSRSDDFKVRVGPFFGKLGKILFASKFFIKKIPVNMRPAFIMNRIGWRTNIFMTDFSKFEATFVRLLLKIEYIIYSWFLRYNKHRDTILKYIRKGLMSRNHIVFSKWAFSILCKRMSGEMNTSEGNGIMNVILSLFLLVEAGNIDPDMIAEGDDGMAEFETAPPSVQDYADLGAVIKIDIPSHWSEGSFCGMIFVPEILDNVSDPLDALMSFGYTTRQYSNASDNKIDALIRAKSLSLLYQYPGCPMLRSLGLFGLRITKHIDKKYMESVIYKKITDSYERDSWSETLNMYRHEDVMKHTVKHETRLLVERKFGIPVDLQLKFEGYIDNKRDKTPIRFDLLLGLCHPDTIDYYYKYGITKDKKSNINFKIQTNKPTKLWNNNVVYKLVYDT